MATDKNASDWQKKLGKLKGKEAYQELDKIAPTSVVPLTALQTIGLQILGTTGLISASSKIHGFQAYALMDSADPSKYVYLLKVLRDDNYIQPHYHIFRSEEAEESDYKQGIEANFVLLKKALLCNMRIAPIKLGVRYAKRKRK